MEPSFDLFESNDRSRSDRFLTNFFGFYSSKINAFLAVFSADVINFQLIQQLLFFHSTSVQSTPPILQPGYFLWPLYLLLSPIIALSQFGIIIIMMEQQRQDRQSSEKETSDPQSVATKAVVFKVVVSLLALVCCIMVTFILAKSSQYFSYLFSLSNELAARLYLSLYYNAFMCSLYVSILGFVMLVANTVLFFYRFTQKQKLLWVHLIYILLYFISCLVTLVKPSYNNHMEEMKQTVLSSADCLTNGYLNECFLAEEYLTYRGYFVSFFIVFLLFFVGYVIVYHYAVKMVLPFVVEEKEGKQNENAEGQSTIMKANKKNQTLVSEMFDEYLN